MGYGQRWKKRLMIHCQTLKTWCWARHISVCDVSVVMGQSDDGVRVCLLTSHSVSSWGDLKAFWRTGLESEIRISWQTGEIAWNHANDFKTVQDSTCRNPLNGEWLARQEYCKEGTRKYCGSEDEDKETTPYCYRKSKHGIYVYSQECLCT